MRAEENLRTDNVLAFDRAQKTAGSTDIRRAVPNAGRETENLPTMILNAERGIINTGTVHGGQHVTTVELPDHFCGGADGDA
ncbi:S-type pyocin domain-containing protein [Streptomyces sp. RS10V-4]|uniref:S-type pyocin domain-containing protein n=1 Tax=Streptomyces rhizoryzae TaxID=2932493 RepID=UPI00200557C1|nr:S-type pyocin domain-containing protein [Streptomyces rhizoryzae]MCK7624642.1 S-type pyocin domain-containing protein [Streptomyces rhizoryzae]